MNSIKKWNIIQQWRLHDRAMHQYLTFSDKRKLLLTSYSMVTFLKNSNKNTQCSVFGYKQKWLNYKSEDSLIENSRDKRNEWNSIWKDFTGWH